jgi:hypothetical protein
MKTSPRPVSQAILYPIEEMNSRWNPIKQYDRAEILIADMQCVEGWMKEKHRIRKWHENLVCVDTLVGEDMQYVADEWYTELSILFGMLRYEILGKKPVKGVLSPVGKARVLVHVDSVT